MRQEIEGALSESCEVAIAMLKGLTTRIEGVEHILFEEGVVEVMEPFLEARGVVVREDGCGAIVGSRLAFDDEVCEGSGGEGRERDFRA